MAAHAIYLVTIWAIPLVTAITLHEAAHGLAAHLLGDHTAWWLGRVSLNPLKHVDPFGTILLPGILLLLHAPFLFGYAKPVPVNFRALRSPRRDMVLIAAAGPIMNISLAIVAALGFHIVGYLPATTAQWLADNLNNAVIINVVLAVFNLFPLPPLDGGRILVGLLPKRVAASVAELEPYGLVILMALLIVLPLLSAQSGVDLRFISHGLTIATRAIIDAIIHLTGNAYVQP
jgi:Zn-dependent protease